jgi:hypothetical protein
VLHELDFFALDIYFVDLAFFYPPSPCLASVVTTEIGISCIFYYVSASYAWRQSSSTQTIFLQCFICLYCYNLDELMVKMKGRTVT